MNKYSKIDSAINANTSGGQITDIFLYDTVPGANYMTFFKDAQIRINPYTNCNEFGNKLPAGYIFECKRIALAVVTIANNLITLVKPIFNNALFSVFANAEFEFKIANDKVVKRMPIAQLLPQLNPYSRWTINNTNNASGAPYVLEIPFVIPPLLEFEANIIFPPAISVGSFLLRLTLEGQGTIFNTGQPL